MTQVTQRIFAAAVLAALAACADPRGIAPVSSGPKPITDLHAETTLAAANGQASSWPSLEWWKPYKNPGLDALMDEAFKANPSLQTAEARLRKALATVDLNRTALQPVFSGGGSLTYERFSKNFEVPPPYGGTWATLNTAEVTASYELDLWGKNRAALSSAIGQARAADVDTFAAKLLLTLAIGQSYIQLAEAYELRDVAQATLDERIKVVDLARNRVNAGLDSQVDLKQAEAAVPAAREQITTYDENIRLAQDELAALAGAGPDRGLAIPRPNIPLFDPNAAPLLPANLPAELMGRRPDIVASRLRIEAAGEDFKSTKAAFYPNIDLTAFAGFQSIGLDRFISGGSAVAGIGPALNLPFFTGNTLRANLRGKAADYDAAVATYDQTLLTALKEIADDLNSLRAVREESAQVGEGMATAQAAYDLALTRYKEGLGTYLQVLSAQEQVLAQRSLAVDLRARQVITMVALIGALGGGFDESTFQGAAAAPSASNPAR